MEDYFAISSKGDNFCHFLFALLHTKPFLKRALLWKERTKYPLYTVMLLSYRIGHDNKGGGAAWFLERVVIDCPSLGRTWTFPCSRWLAKNKGDNELEVELTPQELATEEYLKCLYCLHIFTKSVFCCLYFLQKLNLIVL